MVLSAFSALVALAVLAHQLWWGGFATWSWHGLLALAALWCLAAPSSRRRLVVLAAAVVVVWGLDMPQLGDHQVLLWVISAALLAWWAGSRVLRRPCSAEETWATVAPMLRAAVVMLYAAAAFAKLNTGFLDPATSCAAGISRRLIDLDAFVTVSVWATLVTEAGLAVLLTVPRTRRTGVALSLAFHAVLALAGNVPFAVVVAALDVGFVARLPSRPVVTPRRSPAFTRWAGRAAGSSAARFAALVCLWLLGAALDPVPGAYGGAVGVTSRLVVAVALAAAAGWVLVDRRAVPRARPVSAHRPRLVPAAAVALLVANAAAPYLGLKTQGSFAMYSNLQTAPGHANHLLLPAATVFTAQDDLVRVVRSPDPRLRRYASGGTLMVRFELERYLRANPSSSAWVVPDGAPPGTAAEGPLRAATLPARPVADRVVNFLDVSPGTAGRC